MVEEEEGAFDGLGLLSSFFGSDGSDLLGRMAVGFCTTVPVAYRTFNASSYVELIAITLLSGGAAAADDCRSSCEVELEPAIDLRLGCGVVELEPAPVCACADLSIATRCRYDTFASPLNLGTEPPSGTGTASFELRRLLCDGVEIGVSSLELLPLPMTRRVPDGVMRSFRDAGRELPPSASIAPSCREAAAARR